MDSRTDREDWRQLRLTGVDWAQSDATNASVGLSPQGPFASLPSLFHHLIGGLDALTVDFDEVRSFLNGSVANAIKARQIPRDQIKAPSPDVLFPAIEALRYSANRAEIAHLIASSMDHRLSHSILPSYVEVLKQLSQDEFELLRRAPILGRYAPTSDLLYVFPRGQVAVGYRHIVPEFLAKACTVRSNIPQYVDNLMRLSLVERPIGEQADEYLYQALAQFKFVTDLKRMSPPRSRPAIEKSVLGVTDFGDQFRRACLG